jgi:putative phosphoribosyl transferase
MSVPFPDRPAAGRELAMRLGHYARRHDVIILALPRGGIPVAFEVAQALEAPLDVFVVRKLGVPGHEELAMGAIASGAGKPVQVLNNEVVDSLGIPPSIIQRVANEERLELERREKAYRGNRPPADIAGHVVILIDDGLATGATMRAAALAVKQRKPARTVIAVPVAAAETCQQMKSLVDEMICLHTPEPFQAVGLWYDNFSQTTDDEVRALLQQSHQPA